MDKVKLASELVRLAKSLEAGRMEEVSSELAENVLGGFLDRQGIIAEGRPAAFVSDDGEGKMTLSYAFTDDTGAERHVVAKLRMVGRPTIM